jgi:hypothetical protein
MLRYDYCERKKPEFTEPCVLHTITNLKICKYDLLLQAARRGQRPDGNPPWTVGYVNLTSSWHFRDGIRKCDIAVRGARIVRKPASPTSRTVATGLGTPMKSS